MSKRGTLACGHPSWWELHTYAGKKGKQANELCIHPECCPEYPPPRASHTPTKRK